jgi:sugar phosphate permease
MVDEHGKKIILLVASLSSFLVPFTGSSIIVALPSMALQFHVNAVTLGWITSAYIIAAAVFIVPFGRYADIVGRKKIFLSGVLIFTIASLACAFAPSEEILIAFRFLQGIGGAMLFSTSVAIVTQVYGPGERGWALGITIATDVAKSIAPPMPWMNRKTMRNASPGAKAQAMEARVKMRTPMMKIFFRPQMSASRPNGTMKSATEMMYAEVIQPSATASAWNCAAIAGRATVMEEPV